MSTRAAGGASAWNSVFHSGPNVPEQHDRYHRGRSPIAIDFGLKKKKKNVDNLIIRNGLGSCAVFIVSHGSISLFFSVPVTAIDHLIFDHLRRRVDASCRSILNLHRPQDCCVSLDTGIARRQPLPMLVWPIGRR